MFACLRLWEPLFMTNKNSKIDVEKTQEALQDFKNEFVELKRFDLEQLNLVLIFLTIVDDLFGVSIAPLLDQFDQKRIEWLKR